MSPAEVTEKLGLHRIRDRSWYVHPRYASSTPSGCLDFDDVQLCHNGRGSVGWSHVAHTHHEATLSSVFSVPGLSASSCCRLVYIDITVRTSSFPVYDTLTFSLLHPNP